MMRSKRAQPGGEGGKRVEIRIPADARYVRVVRLAAAGVASGMNFSVEEIEDIKLAVAEACNNAILHGRPDNAALSTAMVTVTLFPRRDHLEIHVEDEGRVPPPGLKRRRPARAAVPANAADAAADEVLPEGGLGLLIIESLMDDVQHQTGLDANTTLRMVKYVRAIS